MERIQDSFFFSYVVKASAISSEDYDAHYQASYVIQELIKMAKLADMSDEAGRKNLIAVTKFIICEAEITVQVIRVYLTYIIWPCKVTESLFAFVAHTPNNFFDTLLARN